MKKLTAPCPVMLILLALLTSCSAAPSIVSTAPWPVYPTCEAVQQVLRINPTTQKPDCKSESVETCRYLKNAIGAMDKLQTLQEKNERDSFGNCHLAADGIPTGTGK